jgi:molybdate transport system substrate-binding protein
MSIPIGRTLGTVVLAVAVMPLHAEQRMVRRDLLIAAAASLSQLAPPLAQAVHNRHGLDVRFTFAGSNTLARQIVEGARIDVFISADEAQMDVVERAGLLVPDTRVDVLSNQLVVIVPRGAASRVGSPDDLAANGVRRVAMGDPEAVPAGVYGRRWLETVRLWAAVQPKVVPLPSSPAVVAAVREGRAEAGIVYQTDVQSAGAASPVAIALTVNPADAPPIRYPAAAIARGRVSDARAFLAFLQSDEATRLIEAAGFRRPLR